MPPAELRLPRLGAFDCVCMHCPSRILPGRRRAARPHAALHAPAPCRLPDAARTRIARASTRQHEPRWAKRHKRGPLGRAALAQEAEQERRQGPGGGGTGAAPPGQGQEQEQAVKDAPYKIDPDLIDEYLSVPLKATIRSILSDYDPRYDRRGIRDGIERGGYRRALEALLPGPPPRNETGTRVADNRARMLERLGRHGEAEPLYRDLACDLPWNPNAHLDLARVLEHLGRREESAAELALASRHLPDCRRAFEAGMHPDPRQLDPALVPLRLIVPMSVISAAGFVRSRAELSAASLLVQSECGLDLYPPSASRLPGCAGLAADMSRFHHLVIEDVVEPYRGDGEPPYYYDLTDSGIDMIGRLGDRLGGGAAARIAASARLVAGIGAHAALEEACNAPALPRRERPGRAEELAALRGTADRIMRAIQNRITFGEEHALTLESVAVKVPHMLSQAVEAPDGQWDVAAALGGDVLGLCAHVAFDQRPHPRTAAQGPPYPDMQDLYALLVRYCGDRGIARPRKGPLTSRMLTPEEIEETTRDMIKVISES